MEQQAPSPSAATPRHDFYQTPAAVILSVYVKSCTDDQVHLAFGDDGHELRLDIDKPEAKYALHTPLYAPVDAVACRVTVKQPKLEIMLIKRQAGVQWPQLGHAGGRNTAGDAQAGVEAKPSAAGASTSAQVPLADSAPLQARPAVRRSKWDTFEGDDDGDGASASAGGGGGKRSGDDGGGESASIDDFFRKLYADADDDTRRAMIKSYQESGGTSLSTNWDEVRKARVEVRPPDGMVAKRYD